MMVAGEISLDTQVALSKAERENTRGKILVESGW